MIIARVRLQKNKHRDDNLLITIPKGANLAVGTYVNLIPIYDRSDLEDE